MSGWQHVVAYEVYQKEKLVFVSPLQSFTVENAVVDAATKLYAIDAKGNRTEVDFQWMADEVQMQQMKARNSKFKNMYNR